jgi:predicted component of type VI protein secretion system
MKSENRKFWASLLMLAIVCCLIAYLTFVTVPGGNKDIIITVLGVLLGGASSAMPNLFGSKDGEAEKFKAEIIELRADNQKLKAMFDTLREEHERITTQLVERFAIRRKAKPAAQIKPTTSSMKRK